MIFVKAESEWWLGFANAVAAGMMTAASACLIEEGLQLGVDERSSFTTLQCICIGGVIGVGFIAVSQRVLDGYGDVRLGIMEGIDARKVRTNAFHPATLMLTCRRQPSGRP